MVLTHGIEPVPLNHTRTRGPNVAHMRDFFYNWIITLKTMSVFLDQACRQYHLLCIVLELDGGGSAINSATLSSLNDLMSILPNLQARV